MSFSKIVICAFIFSTQALFGADCLKQASLAWRQISGSFEKNADGCYVVSKPNEKGDSPFFNLKTIPLEAGKKYRVTMELTSCDPTLVPCMMLGFPANKTRNPAYLFANFKNRKASKSFIALPEDTGLRVHLVCKGKGTAVLKSVEVVEVDPALKSAEFRPQPCFAPGLVPKDGRNRFVTALSESALKKNAEFLELKRTLKPLLNSGDATLVKRISTRLELAERLAGSIQADLARGDADSLLFARRSLTEFQIFLAYFAKERLNYNREKAAGSATELSIREFGAKGDGRTDDTAAFRKALAKAKTLSGNVTLLLPRGRYLLSGSMPIKQGTMVPDYTVEPAGEKPFWISLDQHLALIGMRDFTLRGENGAEILFGNLNRAGFSLFACFNVTVKNIVFSYVEKPFTQGVVEKLDGNGHSFLWRKDAGYPDLPEKIGVCCQTHNSQTGELVREASGKFIKSAKPLGDGLFRIEIGRAFSRTLLHGLKPGMKFAIPFRSNHISMTAMLNSDFCTFDSLTVLNSRAVGYSAMCCNAASFVKCTIKPAPGAVLSTNADGLHCSNSYGIGPYVEGCRFVNMGDDAFNVYSRGWYIYDSTAHMLLSPGVTLPAGDPVSIVRPSTGTIMAELPLASRSVASWKGGSMPQYNFTAELPQGIVSYRSLGIDPYSKQAINAKDTGGKGIGTEPDVILYSANSGIGTVLTNNYFADNRNNGIVVQTDSSLVENNILDNYSIALRFGSFLTWKEGPAPRNLLIRNNRIGHSANGIHCDYSLNTRECAPSRPMRGIVIENNRISECPVALSLNNIDGLTLRNNTICSAGEMSKVRLENVGNAVISGNTVSSRPLSPDLVETNDMTSRNSIRY